MAGQGLRVGPLFAAGGGIILLWSAITGRKWSSVLKSVIKGEDPRKTVTPSNLITPDNSLTGVVGASGFPGIGSGPLPGVGPGGVLSQGAIKSLWIMLGGDPAAAQNASCHAIQESGGRVSVTSRNPDGGTNVGLYQLDTPGGKGAGYTVAQLQNPVTNTRVAIIGSSNGRNWSAWATPGC